MREDSFEQAKAAGMCPHMNFPSSCTLCRSEEQLVSGQEERERTEDRAPHFIKKKSGEQEIVIAGMVHTNKPEGAKPLIDEFERTNPDVVLVEGQPLEAVFPNESLDDIMKKNGEDILKDRGEQVYLLWLAKKQGKEVRHWDAPMREQVDGVLKMKNEDGSAKHTIKDIQEWATVYGVRSLYGMEKKQLTHEELTSLMTAGIPGVKVPTAPEMNEVLKRVTGYSLEELAGRARDEAMRNEDFEKVREFSEPGANKVFGDMCAIRDAHALGVIRQAKQDGFKKIFVGAGRSHAELWEKAVDQMYSA